MSQYDINNVKPLSYSSLVKKLQHHDISNVYFTKDMKNVISVDKEDYTTSVTPINPLVMNNLADLSTKNDAETFFLTDPAPSPIQQTMTNIIDFGTTFIIPSLFLMIGLSLIRNIFFMFKGGNGNTNAFGFENNIEINSGIEMLTKQNISLTSFAGSPEIMEECSEVVSYLKNSTSYKNAGAEIPRGILLEGPPGTGKTLLAKAIASEADANFISISASEFVEMFVGMGASKVRNLFLTARENNPCIIFIDEIDAVGRQRSASMQSSGGNDEREQTLNQLLAEMDGFSDNENILVMAATNRKDILDKALLRPGRFDRIINVPLPDKNSRMKIFREHSKNKKLESDIDYDFLAELSSGFSGAEIKNLLNEAAIFAARTGNVVISQDNILNALDKLLVGLTRKIDDRGDEMRRRVAIHESGHALLAKYYNEYFDLKKVSIQSTYNGAGGYTIFNEWGNITEGGLYTKDLLFKRLVITMGGKAAENIYYGDNFVSMGAIEDLKQANSLAKKMIGNFGMGLLLETFYHDDENHLSSGLLSDSTKDLLNEEVYDLTSEAYEKAKQILTEKKSSVDAIIEDLLLKTSLFGSDIYA
jgi:cell division protease FtsH